MSIVAIIIIVLLIFLWLIDLIKKQRDKKRGYRIELLSPSVLRAGENDYAIVYHEADVQLWFYGQKIKDAIVFKNIPEMKNDERQDFWNQCKNTVLDRIYIEMNQEWKRMNLSFEDHPTSH